MIDKVLQELRGLETRKCICFGFKGLEFCLHKFEFWGKDMLRLDADMHGTVAYFRSDVPDRVLEDDIIDCLNRYDREWRLSDRPHLRVGLWED